MAWPPGYHIAGRPLSGIIPLSHTKSEPTQHHRERLAMSTVIPILLEAERTSFLEAALRRGATGRGDKAVSGVALRGNASSRSAPGKNVPGGMPVTSNDPGHPSVHVVGRARVAKPPIRSVKSRIVPEPDQIQSPPQVRQDLPHRT
jgi:hypothetical protein